MKKALNLLKLFGILALVANASLAGEGGTSSGGGDVAALEFVTAGRVVADALATFPHALEFDLSRFRRTVERVRVVSLDKVYLQGFEVDALNHPSEERVELNRTRWLEIGSKVTPKRLLAIHEYLSLMGEPDANYAISSKYVEWIEHNFQPVARQASAAHGPDDVVDLSIELTTDMRDSVIMPADALIALDLDRSDRLEDREVIRVKGRYEGGKLVYRAHSQVRWGNVKYMNFLVKWYQSQGEQWTMTFQAGDSVVYRGTGQSNHSGMGRLFSYLRTGG